VCCCCAAAAAAAAQDWGLIKGVLHPKIQLESHAGCGVRHTFWHMHSSCMQLVLVQAPAPSFTSGSWEGLESTAAAAAESLMQLY
jgi:hypothetical protein